ncbi:hypothetical protein MUG87_03970 [Ectobacillus sp. JY-23]|uniref:hypothetical protein n=1 Tax=Ectobacillus sp. JY-23 TaxID=2933872 RepID=UPI001FF58687|nr:hypothetical protein [Ectobacillus sp. JY-23]UOY93293.1 hypothetical protein MUG87_03970 [Ectobacillus sp. JY-23]
MIKLVKNHHNECLYWEVCAKGRMLLVHYGVVGDIGWKKEIQLLPFQRAEKEMKKLAVELVFNGCEELEEDNLIAFIVQYPYEEEGIEEALKKDILWKI